MEPYYYLQWWNQAQTFLSFLSPLHEKRCLRNTLLGCSRKSFISSVSSASSQMPLSFICWFLICKSIPSRTPVNCLCLPRCSHGPLHHSNWVSGFVLRPHADIHAHWTTNLHLNLQRIWGIALFSENSLVLMPKTSLQAVFFNKVLSQ